MPFSFALARHRLGEARGRSAAPEDWPDRPPGRVVWAHIANPARGSEILMGELCERHPDLDILATGDWSRLPKGAVCCNAPRDTPAPVRRFLDHFRPDLAIFSGSQPYPVAWTEAASRGIPQVAVDADPSLHPLPLVRPLDRFAFTAFRRPDPRLQRSGDALGSLNDVPRPPRVARGEVEAMATRIASRPVWMAAGVPPSEIDDVLEAHRRAAQLSHRLLLVLEPADPAQGAALKNRLAADGWPSVRRAEGGEPLSDTRVIVADGVEETRLWVRLASITYIGGTLRGGAAGCPPFVPAALGSVVLHGPRTGHEGRDIARLQAGDAAWLVTSGEDLGRAVERFLASDQAADMAEAGWKVTSQGAEVTAAALDALDDLITAMETP